MYIPDQTDFSDSLVLEKYSSAFTLSDMEIFVFPELFFPLVISNIMSPIIWEWRNDPWFNGITKKSFTYKSNRIKQYIMEHYVFNLDLETWGLTTKDTELSRFKDFVDMDLLRQSNALFGYEGDKYYFDMDIRKHFGLDKYTSDIIPYWKTETIEAMTAFRHKSGFTTGAGECVSFSALYAAALFIVGRIPLQNIFLMATPLHSQNFIDMEEGLLTNNRRIVTKNMWYNGTSITTKARRALENEKISMISHISGYIHQIYEKATIDENAYHRFSRSLGKYLQTSLTMPIFFTFLRTNDSFRQNFQYKFTIDHKNYYIPLEQIYSLELVLKQSFSQQTKEFFYNEINPEDRFEMPMEGKILYQDLEKYLEHNAATSYDEFRDFILKSALDVHCKNIEFINQYLHELKGFIHVDPQLPEGHKQFETNYILEITTDQTREEIVQLISEKAVINETARLALYTHRQMNITNWKPFIKAAMERNPVSWQALKEMSVEEVYQQLLEMPNDSIYTIHRLAQPDEVWNFQSGDGLEKAILFANYLYNTDKGNRIFLEVNKQKVLLKANYKNYNFLSNKDLICQVALTPENSQSLCNCCS